MLNLTFEKKRRHLLGRLQPDIILGLDGGSPQMGCTNDGGVIPEGIILSRRLLDKDVETCCGHMTRIDRTQQCF